MSEHKHRKVALATDEEMPFANSESYRQWRDHPAFLSPEDRGSIAAQYRLHL